MFCAMFDLNTIDYIIKLHENHAFISEPPKRKGSYQSLCKDIAHICPETIKYLHRVRRYTLIFWFSPIYFTVGFGRHSEL